MTWLPIFRADTARPWPLADGSVDQIVTSPPYPMLRVYGPDGRELGREATIEAWVDAQVQVFREARRVLAPWGSMLVNLGDKRPGAGGTAAGGGYRGGKATIPRSKADRSLRQPIPGQRGLAGAPWRLALALQGDGWNLVADMIWNPPDPSPETLYGWSWERCRRKMGGGWGPGECPKSSKRGDTPRSGSHGGLTSPAVDWEPCPGCPKCEANDGLVLRRGRWRPTQAHQYMFLFARGPGPHYWDQFATLEPTTGGANGRGNGVNPKSRGAAGKSNPSWSAAAHGPVEMRNGRTVQTWLKGQFAGHKLGVLGADGELVDHHATYTVELPLWAIRGGTSEAGNCSSCRSPWARVVEKPRGSSESWDSDRDYSAPGRPGGGRRVGGNGTWSPPPSGGWVSLGWRPTCACNAEPRPAVVLDPYAGAGTTLLAAEMLGRRAVGLELYLDNCRLTQRHLQVELRQHRAMEGRETPARMATISGPLFDL